MLAVMFVVTLAMNSVIISVQGFKYVKKSIPRPIRTWMKYSRPFKAEDTSPCIVALPAYLAEEGEIHGVYANWDDSCDHVVLDSWSTHTILSEKSSLLGLLHPQMHKLLVRLDLDLLMVKEPPSLASQIILEGSLMSYSIKYYLVRNLGII